MSISTPLIGSIVRGTNTTVTPVSPSDNPGDTILLFTGVGIGTNTLATPSGWTLLSHDTNAKQVKCFGFDSVGSTTIPGILWSGSPVAWAAIATITGCLPVASAADGTGADRASNHVSSIIGGAGAYTPAANLEIGFFFGERNKTSASNGSIFTPPSGFTNLLIDVPSGSGSPVAAISYWIQSTATAIPANSAFSGSLSDAAAQSNQGSLFFLKPAVTAPNALLGWPKQTFVTETIIQI